MPEIQTQSVRRHTLSTRRKAKCFNTSVGMADGYIASAGDWITYVETFTDGSSRYRAGRMLGVVDAETLPSDTRKVRGFLSVLALSDDCCYAYIRWVDPADVRGIRKTPPAAILAFITGTLPDVEMVHKLADYGTLSQSYIGNAEHHMKAWRAGMSPAAYDTTKRQTANDSEQE